MQSPKYLSQVGLVLARLPQYSETFLTSKINGLRESGFQLRVFVNQGLASDDVFVAFQLDRRRKLRWIALLVWSVFSLGVRRPVHLFRLVSSELKLGRSVLVILRRIPQFHHILMHAQPGWLHFGFSALAIGAESLAYAVGARMSVSLRGYDITRHALRNPGCFQHVWKRLDKVHTISSALGEKAKQHGLPASVPLMRISPAVDSNYFSLAKVDAKRDRSPFAILSVARLEWVKGIEYVLMALSTIAREHPEIVWSYTVVGDGPLLERLRFAASEMNLLDEVSFTGRLDREAIRQAYADSDLYVQYSVQEGFCNATLEAQAMELVCIVSDADGLPENVGEQGCVVARRKPGLLAAEIVKLYRAGASERNRIGASARQRVVEEFALSKQQSAFANFFEQ